MAGTSDPAVIAHLRRFTLKQALKLETMGMKRRGQSAATIIKKEFGLKGNNKSVLEQFEVIVEEMRPPVPS